MATAQVYSGAGDGIVTGGSNSSQAAARAASPGSSASVTGTNSWAFGYASYAAGDAYAYTYVRAFYPFAMPAGSAVTAATLNIYAAGTSYLNNVGGTTANASAVLVAGSQASASTLSTSDFSAIGSTELASNRLAYGSQLNTAGYKAFTLNASGLALLNAAMGGTAKLAVITGWDFDNASVGFSNSYGGALGYFSDQTGTSNDPYLDITYTPPAGGAVPVPTSRRVRGLYTR